MSKNLNLCVLVGNIGTEPEIRTVSNVQVAQFRLATSSGGYKKSDGTEVPEKVQWHTIVAWRGLAEVCKYLHKGDRATVTGEISYREYEGKDGIRRYVTDIIANDILLPPKTDRTGASLSAVGAAQPSAVIYAKDQIGGPAVSPAEPGGAFADMAAQRRAAQQEELNQLSLDLPF